MSEFKEPGKSSGFDVENARRVGIAESAPPERTPEQKAAAAKTIAQNFVSQEKVVDREVVAMAAAAAAGDRAAWTKARLAADSGLVELDRIARGALKAASHASDEKVRKDLQTADHAVAVAKERIAVAPKVPPQRVPELSCAEDLRAALMPAERAGEPDPVYKASEQAVKNLFKTRMSHSDIRAFKTILSEHADHEITVRFRRFGEARQARLLRVLDDPVVTATAVLLENSRIRQQRRRDSTPESTPPMTSDAAEDSPHEPLSGEPAATTRGAAPTGDEPTSLAGLPVQRQAAREAGRDGPAVAQIAQCGVEGGGNPLPHLDKIQASFAHHDVTSVQAHHGPAASDAADALGAKAYATGSSVAFSEPSDLHTAAHEAAHVVQQRGGVQLKGGIDQPGDAYERHADAVADAVVAGKSAAPLLDQVPGGAASGDRLVQRSPRPGAVDIPQAERVPPRGDYAVELTADGNYVFVFNTFDMHKWSEPAFTALRYYMQQVFPGIGDPIIRSVLHDLHVGLENTDPVPAGDDQAYEVRIRATLHQQVIAWMKSHHPALAPHKPHLGDAGLRHRDAGGPGGKGDQRGAKPPGMTATSANKPGGQTSAVVEQIRALYGRLRTAFPDSVPLRSRTAWPAFLAYMADHAAEHKLLHGNAAHPSIEDLRKLLAQFQHHQELTDGGGSGEPGGHTDGKQSGGTAGTHDGDVRAMRAGGEKAGSIYGEPGGSKHGWVRWEPRGDVLIQPKQPTYVTGSSVRVELAWDFSVHPDAGLILLPDHCEYRWVVRHNGEVVDHDGHSMFADGRHTSLDLGDAPGMYEIEVIATSNHFKTPRHQFSSKTVLNAISEQAFDKATFDKALAAPGSAFSRDDKGMLHRNAGEVARTPQQEISNLDLSKGGIDTLANQGKITGADHDILVGQIEKQREALLEVQDKTKNGTPYVVRGTLVSREDSSSLPLQLLMHTRHPSQASGVAHYDLVLHDTTLGAPVQHPGRAQHPMAPGPPQAIYHRLEREALDDMTEHFHAHNDYPKGTVHLAAQQLTSDAVWENTLDTDNGRKMAKRAIGTIAAVGGAAMMIVPGGNVIATGVMVITTTAGIAAVALEVEDRIAKEGTLKLDRRLVTDVLQVIAIALPFGTLAKTFAGASAVGKGRFLLCMAGLDVAQGFLIAGDVKQQLDLIEANTAAQLAVATSDDQRPQIHADRDRLVAELIGGAMVNGGFLLVSLGHGIKNTIATTRGGARFTVREPVKTIAHQGRDRMRETLATDTFEHDNGRVQLTAEERRYLEHELTTPEQSTHKDNELNPGLPSGGQDAKRDTTPAKSEAHRNGSSGEKGVEQGKHTDKDLVTPKPKDRERVVGPVAGLYGSIDPSVVPLGWHVDERYQGPHPKHSEWIQIITDVSAPDGSYGYLDRSYDPKTKTLIMENAFLDKLPRWIETGKPMVEGKGTPTQTYLTIRQMKLLSVRYGEIARVKMSTIQNVRAVMELEQMRRNGIPPERAIAKTHSVQYAATTIEQSGHAITNVEIDMSNAFSWRLDSMMDHFGVEPSERKELCATYGLKPSDEVMVNYDIWVDVAPYPSVSP